MVIWFSLLIFNGLKVASRWTIKIGNLVFLADYQRPLFNTISYARSQNDITTGKGKAENETLRKWYAGHDKSFSNVVAYWSTIEH